MAKPKPKSRLPETKKVQLDWRAYFITFCEKHGEPVPYKGRLLFPDGWTYSATAYEGPEFPPPSSLLELDVLTEQYWKIRQSDLKNLIDKLVHERKILQSAQASRDVPLQRVTTFIDGDKKRRGYASVDVNMLDQKIEWVESDLVECDEQLKLIDLHKGKERIK